MEAENLILDDSCQRQIVKEVSQVFPNVSIAILSETFVVESVDLCDLTTFMVSAENCDTFLKSYFEADEKCDCLYRVVSTVDIIAHEKVICIRGTTTDLEKLH